MRSIINLLLSLSLFSCYEATAQADTALVRKKVEAKQYTFIAQSATPLRGQLIQLTSLYDLRVSGDSVIVNLPYYGRAYSAPMGNDAGLNFTSTKSDYSSKWKKNQWQITIKPRDYRDINEIYLTVFNNG